jgi:hypothetical protein
VFWAVIRKEEPADTGFLLGFDFINFISGLLIEVPGSNKNIINL